MHGDLLSPPMSAKSPLIGEFQLFLNFYKLPQDIYEVWSILITRRSHLRYVTHLGLVTSFPGSRPRFRETNVNKSVKRNNRSRQFIERDERVRWCRNLDKTSTMLFHNCPIADQRFKVLQLQKCTDRSPVPRPPTTTRPISWFERCCNCRVPTEMRCSTDSTQRLLPDRRCILTLADCSAVEL